MDCSSLVQDRRYFLSGTPSDNVVQVVFMNPLRSTQLDERHENWSEMPGLGPQEGTVPFSDDCSAPILSRI
jgi:hypothetical protein